MKFVFTVVTEKRTIEILQMLPNKVLSIRIKIVITKAPLLTYFDHNKPITAQTDASTYCLGCVLLQDGKPVCFASKSLTTTKVNYAQITKELYEVVFACKHWHMLIFGKRITTDHRPLFSILKKGLHSSPPLLATHPIATVKVRH